ncbi:YoaK family protein [Streptomyces sp. NPDC007084]|uniref:YoaK family protein n=1 Tax=Streptomyces sp. NPDC007084 TaxID=3154313 RepID=UPI0034563B36
MPAERGHTSAPALDRTAQYLLTAAAGCVNAVGFLVLGGVFTSVMTANLALLGLGLGGGHPGTARLAALTIVAYVTGVVLGGRAAAGIGREPRRTGGLRAALVAECALLWAVWVFWVSVGGEPGAAQRATLLAASSLAMGCQNGGVRVVTGGAETTAYMTGALTGLVAEGVRTRRLDRHIALTVVLIPVGAALGGFAVRWARLAAPALAAVLVTLALLAVVRAVPRRKRGPRPGA